MLSIGGAAYGSSPWTGLQRLQPPTRKHLLQGCLAARAAPDTASLLQRSSPFTNAPVASSTPTSIAGGRERLMDDAARTAPPQAVGAEAWTVCPAPPRAASVCRSWARRM